MNQAVLQVCKTSISGSNSDGASNPFLREPQCQRDDRQYRLHLREEQRRPRRCIARRMPPDFHHGC